MILLLAAFGDTVLDAAPHIYEPSRAPDLLERLAPADQFRHVLLGR